MMELYEFQHRMDERFAELWRKMNARGTFSDIDRKLASTMFTAGAMWAVVCVRDPESADQHFHRAVDAIGTGGPVPCHAEMAASNAGVNTCR